MKALTGAALIFFIWFVDCAPVDSDEDIIITRDSFSEELVIYTAEHDITSIIARVKSLNLDDYKGNDQNIIDSVFFTLAEIGSDGKKIDKGLYELKNGVTSKLLDNGRDVSADSGSSANFYFAGSDGLYKYNVEKNKAEKYGSITDSIIQLAKVNSSDIIYVLTEDKQLYNVTEKGTKKTKIDSVTNPKEIAVDNSKNLYYIGSDNIPYVVTANGIREITGFSPGSSYTKLIRPPSLLESGLPIVSGDDTYVLFPNGTRETVDVVVREKPSAYAVDTYVQYYGYNKKIYKYNILSVLTENFLGEDKKSVQELVSELEEMLRESRKI